MARLILTLLALCAASASARMAYELPDGSDFVLRERSFSQNFDCVGRRYGYYADVDNGCEIFHVCQPIEDVDGNVIETAHFSFLCGLGSVFDQASLTCSEPQVALPCGEAPNFYDVVNAEFGKVIDN